MKKRNVAIALLLSLAMCMTSFVGVFANTYGDGVSEYTADETTYKYTNDVLTGGYKVVDTDTLYSWVSTGKNMVMVDTMPVNANGHIKGAINAEAGSGSGDAAYVWKDGQKATLKAAVEKALTDKGLTTWTKTTKKAYNTAKKNGTAVKKSGSKYYVATPNKKATVVVYCGFVGCARSHIASVYLKSLGYTNVYRYGGGIMAWNQCDKTVDYRATGEF